MEIKKCGNNNFIQLIKALYMETLTADQRFKQTGLSLPPAPAPMGVYKPCLIDGKYLYLSGHGPFQNDKSLIIGRIGEELDMEQGKLAARQVGLTMLSTIFANLGSFNKIKRVIKVLGMVNCITSFEKHPYIINGCSELFATVWGTENGIGVRSAVGFASLPDNIPVEIEALFELE
jgi:enamine deaminase RidA (YjgF/YER057c/UK114 family)